MNWSFEYSDIFVDHFASQLWRSLAILLEIVMDRLSCGVLVEYRHLRQLSLKVWALRIACASAMELYTFLRLYLNQTARRISCIDDSKHRCPWEISALVEDIKV